MRRLAILLLMLALPAIAQADVAIPQQHRVPNRTGSQCAWSSLETLARFHGLTQIHGLTQRYGGLGGQGYGGTTGPGGPERVLTQAGVRFRSQTPPNRDLAILRYAVRCNLGAAVGLSGTHVVTLVGLDEASQSFRAIENSDSQLRVRTIHLSHWDGWTIVLFPVGFS